MASRLRLYEISLARERVLNAISLEKLLLVGSLLGLGPEHRVLDLCCGKGEMLSQWSAQHGCSGHGVDVSEEFVRDATARAAELAVSDRVSFAQGDAAALRTDQRFDVVSCLGALGFAGSWEDSVALMRSWARPDATVVVGEVFWKRRPPAEVVAAVDQQAGTLPETFSRLEALGLEVVEMVLADDDSWDRYRATQWKNLYEFARDHPESDDVPDVLTRLRDQRRRYVSVEREWLGWGVFLLRPTLSG